MREIVLSFLLILFCSSSVLAQTPALQNPVQSNRYTFSQFGNETWDFIRQPTKWDGSDWLKIGVVGAGTFLIMETADQPIRDFLLRDRRYYRSVPIEAGRIWGELYTPVVLFGGFALHSLVTGDIGSRKIAYEIGQASIYGGVVTYLLKMSIGRSRPYTEEGHTSFHPFSSLFNTDQHSLPGGHNVAGFVLSTVLSRNAKPVWLKVLAYLPAALTFVSRAYQDQHWASDDFMGAALGYFIATWVVDIHERQESALKMSGIYPLSISIRF
jgi:membrane-associated phospholipid phosphatase